jgi:hypothetical protein
VQHVVQASRVCTRKHRLAKAKETALSFVTLLVTLTTSTPRDGHPFKMYMDDKDTANGGYLRSSWYYVKPNADLEKITYYMQ